MKKQYYIDLVGRIKKIINIYECDKEHFMKYTQSLCLELGGNDEFAQMLQIKFKLLALIKEDVGHYLVRKTMFECMDIVNKILSNWEE